VAQSEFKQGIFSPINKSKCLNKGQVVYRSSLELRLMQKLDNNPLVLEWSSETHVVPYIKPGPVPKPARYFVDFYFNIQLGEQQRKFLVEVKPHRQSLPPTLHGNKKMSTILYENIQYAINKSKWEAAEKYAKGKNMTFIVITEKNIDQITGTNK